MYVYDYAPVFRGSEYKYYEPEYNVKHRAKISAQTAPSLNAHLQQMSYHENISSYSSLLFFRYRDH